MDTLKLHPLNPEKRPVQQISRCLAQGGLIICPTDSGYSLACSATSKLALKKFYSLAESRDKAGRTLFFGEISPITTYARIENFAYKYMKPRVPGHYTFILPATHTAKKILETKRHEVGIRIPDTLFFRELFESFNFPLITKSVFSTEDGYALVPETLPPLLKSKLSLIADAGPLPLNETTIINFTEGRPELVRRGSVETQ